MPSELDLKYDAMLAAVTGPGGPADHRRGRPRTSDRHQLPGYSSEPLSHLLRAQCSSGGDRCRRRKAELRGSRPMVGAARSCAGRARHRERRPGRDRHAQLPRLGRQLHGHRESGRGRDPAQRLVAAARDEACARHGRAEADHRRCAARKADRGRLRHLRSDSPADRGTIWSEPWRPLLDGADPEAALPEVTPEDDATILFTSGSTGESKGALSTHRAVTTGVYAYATGLIVLLGIMTEENRAPATKRTLLNVPLFHVTGEVPVMLNSFVIGRDMVMMPKWDAGEALRLIEKEGITYFVGVPTMSLELMNHPDRHKYDLSSLTDIAAGGAPRPVSHVERLEAEFPKAQPALGYGLTETNAVGCANFWSNYAAKPDSTGRAHKPFVEIAILGAGRRASARRRARRDRDPVGGEHQMLLGRPRSDRRRLHGGRVHPHRRHRLPRRGRLSVHRRPQEGHHHPRRREHRLRRGRSRNLRLSRGGGGVSLRDAGRPAWRSAGRRRLPA